MPVAPSLYRSQHTVVSIRHTAVVRKNVLERLPVALTIFRGFVLDCVFAHLGEGDLNTWVNHYDLWSIKFVFAFGLS
jgi:hypothetical protein